MEIKEIEKLATLARIDLSVAEKEAYLKDIASILTYVDQIKLVVEENHSENVPAGSGEKLRNVMRLDEESKSGDTKPADFIAEFPRAEGNYLKVKKIL